MAFDRGLSKAMGRSLDGTWSAVSVDPVELQEEFIHIEDADEQEKLFREAKAAAQLTVSEVESTRGGEAVLARSKG